MVIEREEILKDSRASVCVCVCVREREEILIDSLSSKRGRERRRKVNTTCDKTFIKV